MFTIYACAAQAHAREKVIVYFLTCACVDLFAAALPRLPAAAGLRLAALHGRMKQAAREAVLAAFAALDGGAPRRRTPGVQAGVPLDRLVSSFSGRLQSTVAHPTAPPTPTRTPQAVLP